MGAARLLQRYRIDDPLEATQVHGFCGLWGVIALAIFKIDDGIIYDQSKGSRLLVAQLVGSVFIIAWVASLSAIFFLISKKLGQLRMEYANEILGGDIFYFGPITFTG